MANSDFIDRYLIGSIGDEEYRFAHVELLPRPENMIVLGEAGMGKSWLLDELKLDGAKLVSARSLMAGTELPGSLDNATTVLIDALDEAPAFREGDAIDRVLRRLVELGCPRFILSCRAEEWQAATTRELVRETYGIAPLELRLLPFDQEQAERYLRGRLDAERAVEVFETYRERELEEWLGNPHTLSMLANVAAEGTLPESTTALYEAFVTMALHEQNAKRRETRRAGSSSDQVRLDTLGAAFAALIVSGKEYITDRPDDRATATVQLAEIASLPGFSSWDDVSGNRLVRIVGDRSYTYLHRRLAEWLAARWLARHTSTPRLCQRLLGNFIFDGIVPASLRGIIGSLAGYSPFADRLIAVDPIAVIEYGDADSVGEAGGSALLDALLQVSRTNPYFLGWGRHRAKALVRGALAPRATPLLSDRSVNPRLRYLIAEQLAGEALADWQISLLRERLLDPAEDDQIRELAGRALVGHIEGERWPELLNEVREQGTHDATRIAANLMLDAGIENFDDLQVTEIVFAASGLTLCSAQREGEHNHAAILWRHREQIPDERLDGLLDLMAEYAVLLVGDHPGLEAAEAVNLGDALIARRLRRGPVEPHRLYHWLRGFGGRDSYVDADNKSIAAYLQENDGIRHEVQWLWLTDSTHNHGYHWALYRMHQSSKSLALTDQDLAAFLARLPQNAENWREAVHLIYHSEDSGTLSRAAARRFVADEREYLDFVHSVLNPPKPDWQVEQEQRAAKRQAEQDNRWEAFRKSLEEQKADLEAGRWDVVLQPAGIYIGWYNDARDINDSLERLRTVCGDELANAALRGFENYLADPGRHPSADEVAESYANNRYFNARLIILAALRERWRATGTIGELTDEQLITANLHFMHTNVGEEERDVAKLAWSRLVVQPAALERFARLLVEPELKKRKKILMGMHRLTTDGHQAHPKLIERLAFEWLERFPNMAHGPEEYLGNMLFRAGRHRELASLAQVRLAGRSLRDERRRYWRAIALLTDFDAYSQKLSGWARYDPAVFWAVRDLSGGGRFSDFPQTLPTRLAELLVRIFRERFPYRNRPGGATSGDTNSWDATEAIGRLIDRIAVDQAPTTETMLLGLLEPNDAYRPRVLNALAEWRRTRAEQAYRGLPIDALVAITTDADPATMPDLQHRFLLLLDEVGSQVASNDTDSWRGFYADPIGLRPKSEEDARDHLVELLRQHEVPTRFTVEAHIGDNREVDIAYSIASLRLPVELKGQWHRELWTAADTQLAQQQTVDHLADGYGVYLVLWFGTAGKKPTPPPKGSAVSTPATAAELQQALEGRLASKLGPKIAIRVLDVSRRDAR